MKVRTMLMATASLAFAACVGGSVAAQEKAPASAGLPAATPYENPTRHLVYIATPGDEGTDEQSGVIVLDQDHDYRFVKRIPYNLTAAELPGPKISGMTSSVSQQKIYVTTDGGNMWAIDLGTDKVAWNFMGEPNGVKVLRRGAASSGCCERPWTLPGGNTLLVAAAYNNYWYYIDAKTGKVLDKLQTPELMASHNLTVTADGKMGVLAGISGPLQGKGLASAAIVDVANHKVLRYVYLDGAIRPLTMNHDASLAYLNIDGLDGFEILDVASGKVTKRVELPGEMWKAAWASPDHRRFGHGTPSHGIGMTPDESEIWVTDSANAAFQVWDNPGDGRNPVYNPLKTVKLLNPEHDASWISMTNDGKTAIVGDGTIIDLKNHKAIGTIKDEYGRGIHAAEKVLFMTFKDGKLIDTSGQFAIGNAQAYQARIAAEGAGANKQASNK